MKDWEGDEAPAVGMAVKCRVVHATGLQGTGSVCVMCVCVCVMCLYVFVHYVHYMCLYACVMYVLCMCVCVVSPLCGSFLGSALAQGASMCNDVGL